MQKDEEEEEEEEQVPEEAAEDDTSKSFKSTSNLSHIEEKANKEEANAKFEDPAINELMMAEETGGDAGFTLYNSYARYNGGGLFVLGIFFSMFGWMIFNTAFNIWLSVWTADQVGEHSDNYYVGYYVMFGVFYGLFAFFRAFIMALSSPKMSAVIHESMMTNLLFSPLN